MRDYVKYGVSHLVFAFAGLIVGVVVGVASAAVLAPGPGTLAEQLAACELRVDAAAEEITWQRNERAAQTATLERVQAELRATTVDRDFYRERLRKSVDDYLHSQAAIQALVDYPWVHYVFRSRAVREDYRADWYDPPGAVEAIGVEWLVDDLIEQGIVDPHMRDLVLRKATLQVFP